MARRLALAVMICCAGHIAAHAAETPSDATTATTFPSASRAGIQEDGAAKGDRQLPQPADDKATLPPLDPARFGKLTDDAYGAYQRGLYKTAYNLALPRAQNGDPAAQTLVAELLARGMGVPLNAKEAAKWYAAAAERGTPEAQFQYALMLLDGNFVPKDEKQAHALMQAAAEAGNALAQFNFAQLLVKENPGDLSRAVVYYERAAEAGLADAQYALAQAYANGVGGKAQDDAKARSLLEKAARQNFDTAQLDLAQWMIDGRGGERDYKEGFGWMHVAARGGNVAAQNRLSKLYVAALGTDPDPILAAGWYIVARRAGLIDREMEDYLEGLTNEQMKEAVQKANRLP